MTNDDEVHVLRMRIIRLESQVMHLFRHLDIAMPEEAEASEDPRVVALVKEGNMLEAVKRYHEIHSVGLAEAQRSVEDLQKRLGL
jgi:ribosomal protein L7/L12